MYKFESGSNGEKHKMEKIRQIDSIIKRYVVWGESNKNICFYIFEEGEKLISLELIQIDVILNCLFPLLFTKIMQLDGVSTIKKKDLKQMFDNRHPCYPKLYIELPSRQISTNLSFGSFSRETDFWLKYTDLAPGFIFDHLRMSLGKRGGVVWIGLSRKR